MHTHREGSSPVITFPKVQLWCGEGDLGITKVLDIFGVDGVDKGPIALDLDLIALWLVIINYIGRILQKET